MSRCDWLRSSALRRLRGARPCLGPARRSAVEVARQERSDPVQRPAATAGHTRYRHPAAPGKGHRTTRDGRDQRPRFGQCRLGAALAPKLGEPSLEAKRKATEQDTAAKKQAEDERIAIAKLDNCARARAQLKSLDEGQRIMRLNAKGEREYLDDKGRAEEAQRMRGIIASDCK